MDRHEVIYGEMRKTCKLGGGGGGGEFDWRPCGQSGWRVWCGLIGFGYELEDYDELGSQASRISVSFDLRTMFRGDTILYLVRCTSLLGHKFSESSPSYGPSSIQWSLRSGIIFYSPASVSLWGDIWILVEERSGKYGRLFIQISNVTSPMRFLVHSSGKGVHMIYLCDHNKS